MPLSLDDLASRAPELIERLPSHLYWAIHDTWKTSIIIIETAADMATVVGPILAEEVVKQGRLAAADFIEAIQAQMNDGGLSYLTAPGIIIDTSIALFNRVSTFALFLAMGVALGLNVGFGLQRESYLTAIHYTIIGLVLLISGWLAYSIFRGVVRLALFVLWPVTAVIGWLLG